MSSGVSKKSRGGRPIKNLGWQVTFAGLGINLALGILYTWSVISKGIPAEWEWTEAQKAWPYAIACLVFSLVMVPAGRLQDKIGPRLVASVGGILVGIGMIVAAQTTSCTGFIVGIGVLAGAGIGFGYASATPPAVKWFPAARTGLIAGIVVSGFGLASVYASPLAKYLIATYGISTMCFSLGLAFLVVVVGLAQLLSPPPKGYVPAGSPQKTSDSAHGRKEEFTPKEMLGTVQFYLLWLMYACGAGAGLMIICKLAPIAEQQAGIALGFVLVAALSIGNGAGRIVAGVLSDRLGRKPTMCGCFAFQALLMLALAQATEGSALANIAVLSLISALMGANYGANLSLFPSITKDYYGLKNFGVNYGLVFTAWGVGGFFLAPLAGRIYDQYQTYDYAYYGAASLLVLAAIVTVALKPPHVEHEAVRDVKAVPETA